MSCFRPVMDEVEVRDLLNSSVDGDDRLFNSFLLYPQYPDHGYLHLHSNVPSPSGPAIYEPSNSSTDSSLNKRWEAREVQILITAYREHHEDLKNSKSSRGKKSVWEKIVDTFSEQCKTAGVKHIRSFTQIKEKWRVLFDKYKAIVDNNKKTGRGRETFKFFENIDELLGCSDQVRPKFVRQTELQVNHDQRNTESENVEEEEPAKDTAADKEEVQQKKSRKRKRRQEEDQTSESDKALFDLLQAQQESIRRSEERDKEAIEAMMKFQADSERRHQEFMVSVLGKLGDIFSSKNKTD